MIQALMVLLLCQLVGELAARVAAVPVPGPVLGMLLLFALLLWRARLAADVRETTQGLLRHLSLLFVPAGVGVINHFGRIRAEWVAVATGVIASTVLTIAVTAIVFERVARWAGAAPGAGELRDPAAPPRDAAPGAGEKREEPKR
jgi:holin-like protein